MSVLPSGTVTFLFTDVQDSTRLWEKYPADMRQSLQRHDEIIESLTQQHNGFVVRPRGEGDSRFVVFVHATDGVSAAASIQKALHAEAWPEQTPLYVRISLHTGEGEFRDGDYYGTAVNRCARLRSIAHGGQTVLSKTTYEHTLEALSQMEEFLDLGEHPLKGMQEPEHVFQLTGAGLPSEFPPLKSPDDVDEPPAPGKPPFKGLQHFDEADAGLFFGRELLIAKIVGRLREAVASEGNPQKENNPGSFLALIVGASGSGKSSLVRAGLIPSLKRGLTLVDGSLPPEGSQDWPVHVITPGDHPLQALARSLTGNDESETTTLIQKMTREPRSLHQAVGNLLSPSLVAGEDRDGGSHLLLVVDQFEELFTLCRDETERRAFVDNLLTAAAPEITGQTVVVIVLRADFYGHCAQYANLRKALANRQEFIGPMTEEELQRAMEEPARLGDWEFEPGLVDMLLQEVGDEPGALPLLSHALLETWKRRRGRMMTFTGYTESGGIRGAIAKTAKRVYWRLSPEEQAIARNLFLRLTELGEGTDEEGMPSPDTRRRVSMIELLPSIEEAPKMRRATEAVLQTLVEARLITTAEDTAEVAHEALIREWPTLREWLAQDREGLRMHRHLTEAAQEWELLEHDPGALYRGARLVQALEWAESSQGELNVLEQAFLETSHETAERKQAERDRRRSRTILALAGGLLITLTLALVAFQQRQDSLRQAGILLASQAEAELEAGHADRAVLLGLEALENYPYSAQAEHALAQAVTENRLRLYLSQHEAALTDIAWSPHGMFIATAGGIDQTAIIWDAYTGEELLTLTDHPSFVLSLAWSPDGKRLATISGNWWAVTGSAGDSAALERSQIVTITIWDPVGGEKLLELTSRKTSQAIFADLPSGEHYLITGAAWSPDGKRIATIAGDERTIIWDAATGEELFTVPGLESAVNSVAWSPDGSELLTATLDGTIAIWPIQNAVDASRRVGDSFILSGHTTSVWNASWSPDGLRILSAGDDGTTRIWDAETGESLLSISGGTGAVWDAAWSPTGDRIVTAREDGLVRIWDAATGEEQLRLIGHEGSLAGVSWSPDGRELASAGWDGTARVWKVTPGTELFTLSDENLISTVAWSPTGDRIVTGGGNFADGLLNGSVKVWDAATGEVIMILVRDIYSSGQATWSPDETRILTRDIVEGEVWPPYTVRVWDAETSELLTVLSGVHHLEGFASLVRDAVWSPDGTRIANASFDGIAAVYDAATGEVLLTLTQHEGLVFTVDWSPDGKRLATGDMSNTTRIWDVESGVELMTLVGTQDGISGVNWVAWSPDGDRILTTHGNPEVGGADTSARIWDSETGELLLVIYGHTGCIWVGGWSPDGDRIFTASIDGTVRVWDANSGAEILKLSTPTEWNAFAAWSPDGTRLVTAHDLNTAEVWRVWQTTGELIEYAHECCVVRQFTPEERAQYGLSDMH